MAQRTKKWGALGLLALVACQRAAPANVDDALVRVGQNVLTVAEVQAQIDQLPVQLRAQYSAAEDQQQFLRKLADQEVLAAEAERLGYQNAPEVVAAQKKAMVLKLLKDRLGNGPQPGDVTEAAMQRYYQEHLGEFGPPDRARVAIILVKDLAKAQTVRAEAERAVGEAASRGAEAQFGAFAPLVQKYTEEAGARDVTLALNVAPGGYPKEVTDAAANLRDVGSLSPLIVSAEGNYLLQLKERIAGHPKPFEEVKAHVGRSVSDQVRDRKVAALVAELSKKAAVQVFESRLSALRFDDRQASNVAVDERLDRTAASTPN